MTKNPREKMMRGFAWVLCIISSISAIKLKRESEADLILTVYLVGVAAFAWAYLKVGMLRPDEKKEETDK